MLHTKSLVDEHIRGVVFYLENLRPNTYIAINMSLNNKTKNSHLQSRLEKWQEQLTDIFLFASEAGNLTEAQIEIKLVRIYSCTSNNHPKQVNYHKM